MDSVKPLLKDIDKMKASFGIVLKNNTILLTQRKDVPVWVLPGGGVESYETSDDACIREILEETGIHAKILRQTMRLSPINSLSQPTAVFLCEPVSGELTVTEETRSVAWYDLKTLPEDIFPPHRLWIEESLKNNQLIIRDLNEINYMALLKYFMTHPWQVIRFGLTKLIA